MPQLSSTALNYCLRKSAENENEECNNSSENEIFSSRNEGIKVKRMKFSRQEMESMR